MPDRAASAVTALPVVVLNDEPGVGDRFVAEVLMTPGGSGATAGVDGWGWPAAQSGLDVSSPEVLERQYRVTIIERRLIEDSGGVGQWRGGVGSAVLLDVQHGVVASALKAPVRDDYGHPGRDDTVVLRLGGAAQVDVQPVAYRETLQSGDRVLVRKAGGRGWGSPLLRDPDRVRQDVEDGYVSAQAARAQYGVVLDSVTSEVDVAATSAARRQLTAEGQR
jgi:N-methylhydantoinase B